MTSQTAVLTIDVGSGSVRAIIWNRWGQILGMSQHEWTYLLSDVPGGLDFDTDAGWAATVTCIREAIERACGEDGSIDREDIKAVSAASMREGFVLYDDAGEEIWAIPNVDARAQEEAAELLEEGHGPEFFRIAGDWTSLAASARLRWVQKKRPDLWAKAAHMTMLGDWVLYRLSGVFTADPSLGSSSAMFDLRERTWSKHIAQVIGAEHILPQVRESGTVIGEITAAAAAETGLLPGTVIVAGGADNMLGMVGARAIETDQIGIAGGTYWLTAGVTDTPVLDDAMELRSLCHAIPGKWILEGCGFAHGFSTRIVRDGLLREANPAFDESNGYEYLTKIARDCPPGANGVFYFASNVMNTKSWKHPVPSIVGLDPFRVEETGLPSIYRAVMEEAAYGARAHRDMIEHVWGHSANETIFFGGPSRSELWCQIVADVLGVDLKVPRGPEATALGSALCAFVGAEEYPSLDDAVAEASYRHRTFHPIPENVTAYERLYPQWRALNDHMLEASDKGLAPYMWVGAGAASPLSQR
jgi:autoinducer 2 (AI-2) kinase